MAKENTANKALRKSIQRKKQKKILSLFGKIETKKSYDYKRERKDR